MEKIAAVLVASDSRSKGERQDLCVAAAQEALKALDIGLAESAVVPDEVDPLAEKLIQWSDREDIVLILTSGGTGLGPRDVTPEATCRVMERNVPGIPEMLRAQSLKITPHAALSRAVAGMRNRTLIINLPGSPRAVKESIEFLAAALPHAIDTVKGQTVECARK